MKPYEHSDKFWKCWQCLAWCAFYAAIPIVFLVVVLFR